MKPQHITSKDAAKCLVALWNGGRADLISSDYQALHRIVKEINTGSVRPDSAIGIYRRLIDPKAELVLIPSKGSERSKKI
jgi:hypothetical protein